MGLCRVERVTAHALTFAPALLSARRIRTIRARQTLGGLWWPLATTIVVGLSSTADAQVIPNNNDLTPAPWNAIRVFERAPLPKLDDPDTVETPVPEDLPVKTRQHPGYEPPGIRYGSWMFNPSAMAGGFYDSNVFSSNANRRSDVAATTGASLRARTMWNQHGLDIKGGVQSNFYNENSSLNQTDYGIRGNGWIDVTRDLAILTNFQVAHLNEGVGTLSSPANAIAPTPYDLFSGDVAVRKQFNRLAVSFGGGVDSYNFGSTRAQNGMVIRQDARDGQIYTVRGRTDYAFSNSLGWFTSAEYNTRDLRGTPTQSLNSHGYRILTGLNVAFTNVITGEFGGGYVRQSFDTAAIGTIDGPSFRALVTWRPTRVFDVYVKAEQIVTQTSDTSVTGVIASAVQAGIDYELRRNVVLSVAATYESDKFHGQARTDKVKAVESRIKYLPNQFAMVSLFHRYTQRDSSIPIFSYDKHQVGLNVTAQF